MKAIGGYMEFEHYHGSMYYDNLLALNTTRNAMLYAVLAHHYTTIYLPYYLCNCIYDTLKKHNITCRFYNINKNFMPQFEIQLKQDECLLVVNYFGQLSNDTLLKLKKKYENIIVDNTQAFFSRPVENIDTVYNCRKYFGVPDGAFLSTNRLLDNKLSRDSSFKRLGYLLGRFEENSEKHYGDFQENENLLNMLGINCMSMLTENILRSIEYNSILEIRQQNFSYLNDKLNDKNQLNLISSKGPFMYPLLVQNGCDIKKKLINHKVYVPTLWPNVLDSADKLSFEYHLANNLVILPIDQRYDLNDMNYILNLL